MQLAARRYEIADFMAAQEFYHSRGWTDGLPVVPPTEEAVEACLEWAGLAPAHLVGVEPVRARAVTAEKLAVNAVMAGCLPMHFPVVVTAFTAMLQEPFLLHGATASTGGCAVLAVVNGPVRGGLGMDADLQRARRQRPGDHGHRPGAAPRCSSICWTCGRAPWTARPSAIRARSAIAWPRTRPARNGCRWPRSAAMPAGASCVTVMAAGAPRQIMNEWTTEAGGNPRHLRLLPRCAPTCATTRSGPAITPSSCRRSCGAHFACRRLVQSRRPRLRLREGAHPRAEWAGCGKGAVVRDAARTGICGLSAPTSCW